MILSLSCVMTGASHSSLERWAILREIWDIGINNKERILQVKIIFKEKIFITLEIAGHFSVRVN